MLLFILCVGSLKFRAEKEGKIFIRTPNSDEVGAQSRQCSFKALQLLSWEN